MTRAGSRARTGEEGDTQKVDDVRVAYGAHQLALSHELGHGLGQLVRPSLQDGVDGFGRGFHGKGHLLHLAIGPFANGSANELDVGENERPQLGMVAEKIFLHFATLYFRGSWLHESLLVQCGWSSA